MYHSKSVKVWLTLMALVLSGFVPAAAQLKDTLLNMMLSKPYFYNIIKGKENRIYAGTAEGIVEIDGIVIRPYASAVGYLTLGADGQPAIDSNGVRYYSERKYLHLLPYPEMAREEYHAGNQHMFYICSGGRLYIFDILPYQHSYPNHSIRTISRQMLGTYSGIYLNGKKLGPPASPFVDGHIRQFGQRAFICNYELTILEKEAIEAGKLVLGVNSFFYTEPSQQFINDIFPSPDGQHYYIATQDKLMLANYSFTKDSVLFRHQLKNSPVGLITEDKRSLLFFAGNQLYRMQYGTHVIRLISTMPEPILAGVYAEHQVYLLSKKGLYRFNSAGNLDFLTQLEKGHTLQLLSGSELLISSDQGLFLFNLVNRNLTAIIKGVEFNRYALYKNEQTIYAGSVNGLYTIQAADIPLLIEANTSKSNNQQVANLLPWLLLLPTVFIAVLWFRKRKQWQAAKAVIEQMESPLPKETVTREMIEAFIVQHLPNASIKTIADTFQLNAQQIYVILKPDKPGSIIQQLRLNMVRQMKNEQKSIQEIADATGLSVSYLKKLKS